MLARRVAPAVAIASAVTLILLPTPTPARNPPPSPCSPGRYQMVAEPLTVGAGTLVGEAVEVGAGGIALPGLCAAVEPKKLRVTRKGVTRVRATWPTTACTGFRGRRVRLAGTISEDCTTLTGKLRAKKVRRRFAARLSRCGDGVLDAGGDEGCEPPGTALCTATCQATPALGVEAVTAVADPATAWRVGQWNWVHQMRARAPRELPEAIAALLSLGPAAGDLVVEHFRDAPTFEQDASLCVFAFVLEQLDHRAAVPVLTAWLEQYALGDVLRAPSCVTHTLKVLTDQPDRDETYFSYSLAEREDTAARAKGAVASVAARWWSWLGGLLEPPDAVATQRAVGGVCHATFVVTGRDAKGVPRTEVLTGTSFARDFQPGVSDTAIAAAEESDEYWYGASGYRPIGPVSRLQDCSGWAGAAVMGIVPDDGSPWNSANAEGTFRVAETFGERVKNLNRARGGDAVIHFQDPVTGRVDHVAWVAGRRGRNMIIRMKDGQGRPRELELAPVGGTYRLPSDDPQLRRWAGTEPVYHLFDKSRVTVTDPPFCSDPVPTTSTSTTSSTTSTTLHPICANIPGKWNETNFRGDVTMLVFRADGTYDRLHPTLGFTGDWACEIVGDRAFMRFHREPSGRYTERYPMSEDGLRYEGLNSFGFPIQAYKVS